MAEDWVDVPQASAPAKGDWVDVPQIESAPASVKQPILNLFGYSGNTGPNRLDLPEEDKKHLASANILPNDDSNPFAAMNDFLVNQIWNAGPIPTTGKITFGQLARSALGDVLGALEAPFVLPRQAGEASEQFRVGEGTAAGAGTIAGAAMMGGVKLARLPTPEARIAEAPRIAPEPTPEPTAPIIGDNGVFRPSEYTTDSEVPNGLRSRSMQAYRELVQARDLGAIGPEKPEPTFKETPSEMAEQAVPRDLSSAQTPPEERAKILGHEPGEYDQRGKEWIDKIDAPEDVRDAIENIANDHDWFPEARGGVASEASRAAVAEAAGVDPASIDAEHFSTHFDNDGKVRAVIQALRQTSKDVVDAADRQVKEPSIENAAALAEAQMRHTHVLEYTMGLRAESGRSLAAWKDLLREAEHSKAQVAIKAEEETGKTPKGTSDLVGAARDVENNLNDPKAKKLGLQKLIDQAQALVDAEKEPVPGRPPLSPEVAGLIGEARKVLKEFGADSGTPKTELEKLIDRAEKQAIDMVKQGAVKKPIEALPPELQELVDKAQRVTQRFGGIAKGERAALLLARTGRTMAEQEQLARSVSGLTPNQVAKVLEKLRTSELAKKPGWFYWLWQQSLISGLITHTGYLAVNTATVFMERVLAPTVGAVLGKVLGQKTSVAAPLYANVAFVHAVPDAFTAAGEAFRTGNRVPLASEMRLFERGEESPQASGAASAYNTPPGPEWGIWNRVFNETQLDAAARVLGIPGRAANMLHTFFKVLSERASASTRAFEEAHSEGVTGDKFWDRYQYHLDNPSDEALRGAVNDAYSGAFMAKLTPGIEKFANAMKSSKFFKWVFPFQHIPWNIERMTVEYSPFAILGPEMRGALLGQKGAPAQNLAIAKMAVGSSVLGYFVHKLLAGDATADYPTDQEERRKWQLLGIQPNSVKIGGEWVSYERLGPAGNVAHMGASIGSIIQHYDGQDDDRITKAIWAASVAAANQVGNEVGFQTLKNAMEAMGDEKKGARFAALQAGSLLPFSSFNRQNAALIDPYARKVDDLTSALKYEIPKLRETLLPKRDPLYGEPVTNPAYLAIKRTSPVNIDPVKFELDRLKYYPGQPTDRIHGVKLTPEIYAEYQVIAGGLVKQMLQTAIGNENWHTIPIGVQQRTVRAIVDAARNGDKDHPGANGIVMARHPEIIQQALQDRKDVINGEKPKKKLTPIEQVNTQYNILGDFVGKLFGSTDPSFQPAEKIRNYPAAEDVEFAKKAGFYQDIYEPWTTGEVARVIKGSGLGQNISDLTTEEASKLIKSNPVLAEVYAKGALVVNRIPIAALGFNPDRTALETTIKKPNVAGAYSPEDDRMFVIAASASTIVHESIHRGLAYLRQHSAEARDILNVLRGAGSISEESIVRYLMATQAGNPEEGTGKIADSQRSLAMIEFDSGNAPRSRVKSLERLSEIAQDLIAKRYPSRGQRQ